MYSKEPNISVGILSEKEIKFELYGDFSVQGFKQTFSGRFSAEVRDNRIFCKSGKDIFENSNEIIFKPSDPALDSFFIMDVPIGIKFHWERKEKQGFMGSLKLFRETDKIWAINILTVDRYLTSVISSEMSSKSSLQLLKAHAIVSRSWLLAQIEKAKFLKENGISVKADTNKYLLHDKVFIINNEILVLGSYNPTGAGNTKNDENLLIIYNKELANKMNSRFNEIYSKSEDF